MRLEFTKMQATGNDYIYIDCLNRRLDDPASLSIALSDRHFGIGGDGVVLICESRSADARMRMYNSDGSEGLMCGNAIRCVAKYLYDGGLVCKAAMSIETASGVKDVLVYEENGRVASARVDMGKAELSPAGIPVNLPGERVVDRPLEIGGLDCRVTCVSMGNPHAVVFRDDFDLDLDLRRIGPLFENHPMFPDRVNAEFVKVVDEKTLKMRVWERGSGETLSCGTGACAAAVAAVLNGFCAMGGDIAVILPGGELTINYTQERVFMTGGCARVFEGTIEI